MQYFTTKDLLYRFQVSAMTLWRMERDQKAAFPPAVMIGRSKRWRRSDIEQWEMKRYGTTSALEVA